MELLQPRSRPWTSRVAGGGTEEDARRSRPWRSHAAAATSVTQRPDNNSLMHKLSLFLVWQWAGLAAAAQADTLARTRFVAGLSAPELLHTGLGVDLGKSSQ